MDSIGVDVQIVSTNVAFYKYDQEVATTTAIATDCNDEVRQMTMDHPDRLSGLATLPMQDIPSAIAELDRAVNQLGFKGAMIGDHVNGVTYDDPRYLPLLEGCGADGCGAADSPGSADDGHSPPGPPTTCPTPSET